jgi:hypothetical protein
MRRTYLLPLLSSLFLSNVAIATGFLSDATKLGANTGAMTYCANNFADNSSDKRKYRNLGLLSLKEFNQLTGREKAKALVVKRLAEDKGEYYGKRLTRKSCTNLRKTMSAVYLVR